MWWVSLLDNRALHTLLGFVKSSSAWNTVLSFVRGTEKKYLTLKVISANPGPFLESKERKIDFLYHLSRTNRTRFKIVFQLDLHSVLASFKRKGCTMYKAYIWNGLCRSQKVAVSLRQAGTQRLNIICIYIQNIVHMVYMYIHSIYKEKQAPVWEGGTSGPTGTQGLNGPPAHYCQHTGSY